MSPTFLLRHKFCQFVIFRSGDRFLFISFIISQDQVQVYKLTECQTIPLYHFVLQLFGVENARLLHLVIDSFLVKSRIMGLTFSDVLCAEMVGGFFTGDFGESIILNRLFVNLPKVKIGSFWSVLGIEPRFSSHITDHYTTDPGLVEE